MFLVLLLYALFASVFTISKTGLEHAQPFFFVGSRMAVAGLILLGYLFIRHREMFRTKLPIKLLCLLALFNIYLTNVFEFWGLQYLTSFKTCFIYSLSPFLSALFSYFALSETLSWKKWVGLAIGMGGLIPVLLTHTEAEASIGQLAFLSWPEIAVICAAICSVYGWIVLKQVVEKSKCSPMMANGFSMLLGGLAALGHSFVVEDWNPIPVQGVPVFLECALLLIVISNLICYNLYGHLLKSYSATFMSFAGFSTPMFSALFGWLYLGEVISWHFYLSAIIVFAGLLIFYIEELNSWETLVSPKSVENG